ncbi:hypothetical protein IAU60_000216 [Kwoniella sp. DSM 27419]
MFVYNVHTPQKTFALTHKDDETRSKLFEKVWSKSGQSNDQKEGSSLLYEYEGERWSLDDDDDLEILLSRFPPSSTPSVTMHLQLPQAHAHFNSPPSYSAPSTSSPSSKIKSKSTKTKKASDGPSIKSVTESNTQANAATSSGLNGISGDKDKKSQSNLGVGSAPKSKVTGQTAKEAGTNLLAPPAAPVNGNSQRSASTSVLQTPSSGNNRSVSGQSKAKSFMSTKSRKSKWGDDDAEPLGLVKRREWEEFHNNNGVRTVVGKINGVSGVRMLLKSGYKGVYVSRTFAIKHNIVPKKFGMGSFGYTGLKSIGTVDITIGSKTAAHQAYLSEENHFDVILGRQWLERMAIKIDALDPTALTYMDNGESIDCDIVVLKDDKGHVITIT